MYGQEGHLSFDSLPGITRDQFLETLGMSVYKGTNIQDASERYKAACTWIEKRSGSVQLPEYTPTPLDRLNQDPEDWIIEVAEAYIVLLEAAIRGRFCSSPILEDPDGLLEVSLEGVIRKIGEWRVAD